MTDDLFGDDEPRRKAKRAKSGPMGEAEYNASAIEVLEGLEPVRRRPGMYIGGTDANAMHHLFAEVIDNAMDEAVAGHAKMIEVALEEGNWLSVTDNGRGMPVDPHPKFKNKSALEVIMTVLHAGGKFDSGAYETSRRPARRRRLRGQRAVGAHRGRGRARADAVPAGFRARQAGDQAGDGRARAEPARHQGALQAGRARFSAPSAKFDPARLFKMTRSKAYLFGGVEIRWRCAARCSRPTARRRPKRCSTSPAA